MQIEKSYRKCVREAASVEGFVVNSFPVRDGDRFSDKPVQLVLSSKLFCFHHVLTYPPEIVEC